MAAATNVESAYPEDEMCLPSEIAHSIIREWRRKQNHEKNDTFSSAMAQGLSRAGIPHRGEEAVRIHALLLNNLFQRRNSAEKEELPHDKHITWTEYFQLLSDVNLKWHNILEPMLPVMPLPVACHYLENLVVHAETTLLVTGEVTTGDVCLCVGGLCLGLSVLLDLLLLCDDQENEHVGVREDSNLHSLMTLTGSCLDIVLYVMNLEAGLQTCLSCDLTFRAVTHSLLLTFFVACPFLSVDASQSQLLRYVSKAQLRRPCVELSQEEKMKKKGKTLRQQREESWGQQEEEKLPLAELALMRPETERANRGLVPENSAEVWDQSAKRAAAAPSSDEPETVDAYCRSVISNFKFKFMTEHCEKLVPTFCRGPFFESKTFYELLSKVTGGPEPVCIGRHQFSHLVLREQVFPLLWYLAKQEEDHYPAHCESLGTQELLTLLERSSASGDGCPGTQEALHRLRRCGQGFPNDLLWLHLSEADRVLSSKRLLSGDTDLALLSKVVEMKQHGWRDLLSLGLKSEDFQGWWENGFFNLFWSNEASVATKANVVQAIRCLYRAAQSERAGLCDKLLVNKVQKLVSVMFQRLPPALQEHVVQLHLDSLENSPTRQGMSNQPLSSLMTEEQVVGELTFILNRLTEETADQQTPFLLHLCLFRASTVVHHLVMAAISTSAQTVSVVKVLRNMSSICQRHEPNAKTCQLVTCISSEIGRLEMDDKQVQIVANFLATIPEPYSVRFGDGHAAKEEQMPGVLSVAEILHHFVFPCLGDQTDPASGEAVYDLCEEAGGLPVHPPELGGQTGKSHSKSTDVASAEQKSQRTVHTDRPGGLVSLDISLRTLELFLQRAVQDRRMMEEEASTVLKFQPLPLVVALCDCYCDNYTVLVEAAEGQRSLLQICHSRKTRRLASYRCVTLLIQLLWPAWDFFSVDNKVWLYHAVRERGWFHTALLAPLFVQLDDWKTIYEASVDDLCEAIASSKRLNTGRLVYLLQLAVVNDTMFQTVCSKLPLLEGCLSSATILVALKWIFSTAVPEEMARIVQIVKLLLSEPVVDGKQDWGGAIILTQLEDKDAALYRRVCQSLVDAALLLVTGTQSESLRCHGLTNYQAAMQSLLADLRLSGTSTLLLSTFCQHCSLLAVSSGQAAQILQVTALDILSKFKSAVASKSKKKRSGGEGVAVKSGSGRTQVEGELQKALDSVCDCIVCVDDPGVRLVLTNQLRDITV